MRTYVETSPMATVVRAAERPPGFRRVAGAVAAEVMWLATWAGLTALAVAVANHVPDAGAAAAGWVLTGFAIAAALDQLLRIATLLIASWRHRRGNENHGQDGGQ